MYSILLIYAHVYLLNVIYAQLSSLFTGCTSSFKKLYCSFHIRRVSPKNSISVNQKPKSRKLKRLLIHFWFQFLFSVSDTISVFNLQNYLKFFLHFIPVWVAIWSLKSSFLQQFINFLFAWVFNVGNIFSLRKVFLSIHF